jgi:hypothetical protein
MMLSIEYGGTEEKDAHNASPPGKMGQRQKVYGMIIYMLYLEEV